MMDVRKDHTLMKLRCMIGLLLMTAIVVPGVPAAPIDDLIAAAKKEGAVECFAAGTLGAEGAQKLGEAFNKKYGFNLKTIYHPSSIRMPVLFSPFFSLRRRRKGSGSNTAVKALHLFPVRRRTNTHSEERWCI